MGILANILAEKDRKTYNIMKRCNGFDIYRLGFYTPLLNGKKTL